ncbi:MAG: hypothetical protein WBB23_01970 [Desulforhopalus sp.]
MLFLFRIQPLAQQLRLVLQFAAALADKGENALQILTARIETFFADFPFSDTATGLNLARFSWG